MSACTLNDEMIGVNRKLNAIFCMQNLYFYYVVFSLRDLDL